jgi:hypothetical protein
MKINLSTTTIDLSIMAILLGLKIAIWAGLIYIAQHFVIKFW